MKNIIPYICKNTVKLVKKVCRDVIDRLKIWKNTVKLVKILNEIFNQIFNRFLTSHFDMQSINLTILTILTAKTHTQKKSFPYRQSRGASRIIEKLQNGKTAEITKNFTPQLYNIWNFARRYIV